MDTPKQIEVHADRFKEDAWKDYTPAELSDWVILLSKRATHRKEPAKAAKDIADARNYLSMLGSWVDEQERQAVEG